ncbi:MAG: YbhB/YbcL family Raf kinase inhibitor-like protein [Myxococcota bacterium]
MAPRTFVFPVLLISLAAGCDDNSGGSDTDAAASSSSSTTDPTGDPSGTTSTTASPTGGDVTTGETQSGSESTTTGDDPTATGSDSSSGGDGDSSSTSGEPVEFALTSPAFEQDGLFPVSMHSQGGNTHPQLDWVGAPAGTQSFGVFFHDVSINFEHSAIWNVPADVEQLPEGLSTTAMPAEVPGAVQPRNWFGQFGYGGPGSASNIYQFTIYALDVDDLSGEIDQNSQLPAVRAAFEAHAIASTALSGQTQAP